MNKILLSIIFLLSSCLPAHVSEMHPIPLSRPDIIDQKDQIKTPPDRSIKIG